MADFEFNADRGDWRAWTVMHDGEEEVEAFGRDPLTAACKLADLLLADSDDLWQRLQDASAIGKDRAPVTPAELQQLVEDALAAGFSNDADKIAAVRKRSDAAAGAVRP